MMVTFGFFLGWRFGTVLIVAAEQTVRH